MKNIRLLSGMILAAILSLGMVFAQSGYDLFQKALVKERAEGDLKGAIPMFQRVVREAGANRELAAKALVEMGGCYEKLGQGEAQKAYERVLRDYADQSAQATEARTRLAALSGGGARTNEMVMRRIWAGSEVDSEGSPSSDGRYLPYVDWETGDLAIRNLVTGEKRHLTHKGTWAENDEFAEYSVPSPDGKQVAYAWYKGDEYELRIIGIDGSHVRTLYRNDSVSYVEPKAWTPDGKQILATFWARDHNMRIVMVSVADGSVRVLKNLQPGDPLQQSLFAPMCISPDGRYIAYSPPQPSDETRHDIFLLPIDGSKELPIVTHPADDYFLGWAPGGKTMLFASDRTGAVSAWTIEVIDGKPHGSAKLLRPDVGGIEPLGFTQNGSFYYALSDTVRDLYTASLDLATGKLLTPPTSVTLLYTGANSAPAWSDDGKYLAYLSLRHRPRINLSRLRPDTIVIRSLETGEEREVVPKLGELAPFTGLRWSPDGRSLLVRGTDKEGRGGVFRINAQSAEASLLLEEDHGSGRAFFCMTHDGKSLIYNQFTPKGLQFVIHDLGNGQVRDLTHPQLANGLALSPDGREIAFDTLAEHGEGPALMVVPLAGGEPRPLYSLKSPADFAWNTLDWTDDGARIVFGVLPAGRGQNDPKTEMWEIAAGGGAPHKLGLTGETVRNLRIHPDAKRIAFEAGAFSSEVGVMENFLPALRSAK